MFLPGKRKKKWLVKYLLCLELKSSAMSFKEDTSTLFRAIYLCEMYHSYYCLLGILKYVCTLTHLRVRCRVSKSFLGC